MTHPEQNNQNIQGSEAGDKIEGVSQNLWVLAALEVVISQSELKERTGIDGIGFILQSKCRTSAPGTSLSGEPGSDFK